MEAYLSKRGAQVIGSESVQDADFAIVVTCGFNQYAVKSGRALIDHARAFLDDSRILVMGCLPGTAPDSLTGTRVNSVAPRAYGDVDEILARMGVLRSDGPRFSEVNNGRPGLSHRNGRLSTSTYYIRVSSGCAGKCSYCKIRDATGKNRSRALADIRAEITDALNNGMTAIYLGADDLGAWGIDRGDTFPKLLACTLDLCVAASGAHYVDLRNVINPVWLVKYRVELETLFRSHAERLPTLSVALQSASPTVLRACKRYHAVHSILETVRCLHQANPLLYSFGHLIIGLPYEGAAELEETLAFVDSSPIHFWTCFKYSNGGTGSQPEQSQVNANWETFIESARKRGYYVREQSDRVYVARKLDPRYITIEFRKNSRIEVPEEDYR